MSKEDWEPPYAICGAKRKEARGGGECRQKAGAGTDHPGVGRCRWHGGATKSHRNKAVRDEAEARLKTLGMPIEVKAHDALEAAVAVSAGAVAWLGEQVAELDPDEIGKHNGRVLVTMYGEERDRLVRTSKAAVESGVAERQVRLAEQQGELVVRLVRRVLAGLGLTREQEATAKELVRQELSAIVVDATPGEPTGRERLLGK